MAHREVLLATFLAVASASSAMGATQARTRLPGDGTEVTGTPRLERILEDMVETVHSLYAGQPSYADISKVSASSMASAYRVAHDFESVRDARGPWVNGLLVERGKLMLQGFTDAQHVVVSIVSVDDNQKFSVILDDVPNSWCSIHMESLKYIVSSKVDCEAHRMLWTFE